MLPSPSEFLTSPFASFGTCIEVFKLHTARVSAETAERRKRTVEDVQKRSEYRKAHGLDKETGFGGWTAKTDGQDSGPAVPTGGAGESKTASGEIANAADGGFGEHVQKEKKPLKKWLGIW